MITHKKVEKYLLSMPGAKLDYPFGEDVAVYFVKGPSFHKRDGARGVNPDAPDGGRGKMFALIAEKKKPVRLSLKCDPVLAETLRQKYESVLPGYHLSKKHWNTIILSGQLSWDEVKDLIKHSYALVNSG